MADHNPFLDPRRVAHDLYGDERRLTQRITSLLQAKVRGANPVKRALDMLPERSWDNVADVGCGLGSATRAVQKHLRPRRLFAVDQSPAMAVAAKSKAGEAAAVVADFHRLPFPEQTLDLIFAGFCLYHSPTPDAVCGDFARCLRREGHVLLLTKSQDSYRAMDDIVQRAGLGAPAPSLYASFPTEHAAQIASLAFARIRLNVETHEFRFSTPAALASYVVTSPKYETAGKSVGEVARLLAPHWPACGLITTSVVGIVHAGMPTIPGRQQQRLPT